MDKPVVQYMRLESGRHFVRFRDIEDAYWYDDIENPIDRLASIVKKDEVLGVDKNLPAHFLISS